MFCLGLSVCLSVCLSVGLEEVADQFLTLEIRTRNSVMICNSPSRSHKKVMHLRVCIGALTDGGGYQRSRDRSPDNAEWNVFSLFSFFLGN